MAGMRWREGAAGDGGKEPEGRKALWEGGSWTLREGRRLPRRLLCSTRPALCARGQGNALPGPRPPPGLPPYRGVGSRRAAFMPRFPSAKLWAGGAASPANLYGRLRQNPALEPAVANPALEPAGGSVSCSRAPTLCPRSRKARSPGCGEQPQAFHAQPGALSRAGSGGSSLSCTPGPCAPFRMPAHPPCRAQPAAARCAAGSCAAGGTA